ncbi:DEAD/DEAH box helicase [Lactococcus fujiensis]|nr:DEAD/DEAH box helicase [Lactococcus fujiensis]
MKTIKYISASNFSRYFPFEDNIFGETQEEVFETLAILLGLSVQQLEKIYSSKDIGTISIHEKVYFWLQKDPTKEKTWVQFLLHHTNKNAYRYLATNSEKSVLPKSITELFNLEPLQESIQSINSKIVYKTHPLIESVSDETFNQLFESINFYKQQKRVIKEGANALLNKVNSFFYLGEMGVGKTMTSVAMFEMAKKLRNTPNARCAVIAPDHLVSKWKDEILLVNASVTVDILPEHFSNYKVHTDYLIIPLSFCSQKTEKQYYDVYISKMVKKTTNIIGKQFKNNFALSIFDESHLLSQPKFADQLHELAHIGKQNILATGTSIAGKVTDMFPQIFGFFQDVLVKLIDEHVDSRKIGRNRSNKMSKSYNIIQKAYTETYGSYSYALGRNSDKTNMKTEVGLNAEFITDIIIQNAIFLTTEQVWDDKVENLIFQPIFVQMTPEQKNAANLLNGVAKKAKSEGDKRVFSRYLTKINEYMDNPEVPDLTFRDEILWTPEISAMEYYFDDEILLPKEQKLVDIITMEKSQDRPVIVFVKHIDRLKGRLQSVLQNAGFKVGTLPASRKADERQDYINKKICNEKVDVMLLDPHKVATGVDLISAPTVLFFNTGFDYFEVGQSERRSFRIGQRRQTRVYYLAYAGDADTPTIQDQVLTMIAQKKRAMEAVQGSVDEEGLSSLLGKENNSILNALVANMDNDNNTVKADVEDFGSKQEYYLSNFGKELEVEDGGRPQLDENLNFIWPGLDTSEYAKVLPSKISQKEMAKKPVEETIKTVEEVAVSKVDFSFDDDGMMDLFSFDDYDLSAQFTTIFAEEKVEPVQEIEVATKTKANYA